VKCVLLLVDQQFSYVRLAAPLLDTAAISTEFSVAISTQFCFVYPLGGATAMLRGLQARLCHASYFVCFWFRAAHQAGCLSVFRRMSNIHSRTSS